MHEPGRVRSVERVARLCHQRDGALGREPTFATQKLAQIDAVDVVHREVEHATVLAGRDRLHDVRVVERRSELRLAQEALPEPSSWRRSGESSFSATRRPSASSAL